MSQEIEIEYKNLLTKEEFDYLLTSLPFTEASETQVNYYFETQDLKLSKKSSALRIRLKHNNYQLTLKEPHDLGILETHDTLSEKEAIAWLEGDIIEKEHTLKQLTELGVASKDLIYYGSLTTVRYETSFNGVLLVLDYSTYNGQSDYEFELEAPNRSLGLQNFNTILARHQIQKRHTPNKIERFFSTLAN